MFMCGSSIIGRDTIEYAQNSTLNPVPDRSPATLALPDHWWGYQRRTTIPPAIFYALKK